MRGAYICAFESSSFSFVDAFCCTTPRDCKGVHLQPQDKYLWLHAAPYPQYHVLGHWLTCNVADVAVWSMPANAVAAHISMFICFLKCTVFRYVRWVGSGILLAQPASWCSWSIMCISSGDLGTDCHWIQLYNSLFSLLFSVSMRSAMWSL